MTYWLIFKNALRISEVNLSFHFTFSKFNLLMMLNMYIHAYTPLSLIFLKRFLVFPILLFSSISLHWSLRKAFAILWNSAFRCFYLSFSPLLFTSLLFTAIWKASPNSYFAFLHVFSFGMVSCTMSQTSVHSSQAVYLSGLVP